MCGKKHESFVNDASSVGYSVTSNLLWKWLSLSWQLSPIVQTKVDTAIMQIRSVCRNPKLHLFIAPVFFGISWSLLKCLQLDSVFTSHPQPNKAASQSVQKLSTCQLFTLNAKLSRQVRLASLITLPTPPPKGFSPHFPLTSLPLHSTLANTVHGPWLQFMAL